MDGISVNKTKQRVSPPAPRGNWGPQHGGSSEPGLGGWAGSRPGCAAQSPPDPKAATAARRPPAPHLRLRALRGHPTELRRGPGPEKRFHAWPLTWPPRTRHRPETGGRDELWALWLVEEALSEDSLTGKQEEEVLAADTAPAMQVSTGLGLLIAN